MAYQNTYGYSPYPNQNYPYYNYYTGQYQQPQQVQQVQSVQPIQPVQQTQGFQWVQGEAAARAYHVEPGQTVLLMDSDSPVLYFKSSDQSGRPIPMVVYDLVERKGSINPINNVNIDLSEYIKKDEIQSIINETVEEAVAKRMNKLKENQSSPSPSPVVATSMITNKKF